MVEIRMFHYVMVVIIGVAMSQGCPEYNCSQGKLFDGDDVFKCDIRTRGGWEDFQQENNVSEHYSTREHVSIAPPMLTAINWYTTPVKEYGTIMFSPTLNVTFRVPFEKNTEFYAVLLKFESPNVPGWKDEFFVDNPRYRFFDFHQYSPFLTSTKKMFHRDISYPCIQYLDESDSMRVYHITLTGFIKRGATPGVSYTHIVTAYNPPIRKLNPVLDLKEWRSTIVMAVISGTYNVYVVFELAPERVLYYQLDLLKVNKSSDESKIQKSIKVNHPINNHTFRHNAPGIYIVKISPYSQKCSGFCSSSESYYITVNKIEVGTSVWYLHNVLILASVVVMLVVTSVVFCVWRLRESREIFLLEFCENSERPKVIQPLAQYLKEATKYRVTVTRSLPKDFSDGKTYLLRFCKKLKLNNSKNRLILIRLCNCHIADVVRNLENKRNEQRMKVLSNDVILFSLGPILNLSDFDLLNSYTVLDLTKDQDKLWRFISKNESFSNITSSPHFKTFTESIDIH